ncbi:cupin domain-containing protein [Conexibacter sp. W3-3-2]|uniref:cupin domain-containing protein n=1 Tax=Conexibacter sp. W3-3-2 TaxID=2675227 RepID=UPI0012B96206|nr:cupin domain-containing protein [Conexibacter sp. W3-3-2]MTD45080.1 cupin domain-containing protein [Conexibacter sp. W3-3-2]
MPASSHWFIDALMHVHVDGTDTGDAYALVECLAPAGHMPPPHVHRGEAEGFHVLEGELTVHGPQGATVLRPGDSLHAPAGEPHTIEVTSAAPCRMLIVSVPAGFERFVRAFGEPAATDTLPVLDGPPDVERLARIAGEHGITFVGPPGTRPAELAPAVA